MDGELATAHPHDVFISYSSKDKNTADAICAGLERDGARCWIAPRDVAPGEDWAGAIIRGINGAQVFVLVFSTHANQSVQVRREVERAASHEKPIIPFRIEDVAPQEALEYFLSSPHWMDAITPPLESHISRLSVAVRRQLIPADATPSTNSVSTPAPQAPAKRDMVLLVAGWSALAFAIATLLLALWAEFDHHIPMETAFWRAVGFLVPSSSTYDFFVDWRLRLSQWSEIFMLLSVGLYGWRRLHTKRS